MESPLEIVIFSFNRGTLLENCVRSARRASAEAKITIVDDASDNQETKAILRELSEQNNVKVLRMNENEKSAYGGLHANMSEFFKQKHHSEFVFFLQDDMQFIRRITKDDYSLLRDWFAYDKRSVFVFPTMRKKYADLESNRLFKESTAPLLRRISRKPYAGFSDVTIINSARLKRSSFVFQDSELKTSCHAEELFGTMAEIKIPLVAHNPSPMTFRRGRDTLSHAFWAKKHAGCFPILQLSQEKIRAIELLYPDAVAIAEQFLECPSYGPHPWPVFRMGFAPPWLRSLDRLELAFLGLFERFKTLSTRIYRP